MGRADQRVATRWNPNRIADVVEVKGSENRLIRVDDTTTAGVTYIGEAAIGSTASQLVWQIIKIDESSGLLLTWADGNDYFDNSWDNRASLSYS